MMETEIARCVGINGIGPLSLPGLRAGCAINEIDVLRVDDIATDSPGTVHLLKLANVHHTWDQDTAASVRKNFGQE